MASALLNPRRLSLNLVLVTIFLFLAISAKTLAADALSKQIDHDLFLDDEGGSGDCGSGDDSDDEDKCQPGPNTHTPKGVIPGASNPKSAIEEPPPPPHTENPNGTFIRPNAGGSFFSQPGILAAIICGAIVGLLCAILLVMFIVYRMRKKDEGSYVLDDSKRATPAYGKSKEFYA